MKDSQAKVSIEDDPPFIPTLHFDSELAHKFVRLMNYCAECQGITKANRKRAINVAGAVRRILLEIETLKDADRKVAISDGA